MHPSHHHPYAYRMCRKGLGLKFFYIARGWVEVFLKMWVKILRPPPPSQRFWILRYDFAVLPWLKVTTLDCTSGSHLPTPEALAVHQQYRFRLIPFLIPNLIPVATRLRPELLDLSLRFSADSSKLDPPKRKKSKFRFVLLPPDYAISLKLMVQQKWFTYKNCGISWRKLLRYTKKIKKLIQVRLKK